MGLKFYVTDTETNGLSAAVHEITELSIIRCDDGVQITEHIKILHPERTSPQALSATGRTRADLLRGKPKKEVVEVIDSFIQEDGLTPEHRCFIAHNESFDRRFLHELWRSCGKNFPAALWLDTKTISKQYIQNYLGIVKPKLKLGDCLASLNLEVRGQLHTSKDDTENCHRLYKFFVENDVDVLPLIKRHSLTESSNDSNDE